MNQILKKSFITLYSTLCQWNKQKACSINIKEIIIDDEINFEEIICNFIINTVPTDGLVRNMHQALLEPMLPYNCISWTKY